MRLLLITTLSTTMLLLNSCFHKKNPEVKQSVIFSNNAEIDDWTPVATIKQNANAHSGKYVSVIDSVNVYSLGLSKKIIDISTQKIDSVIISYWVYLKNNSANACTVISVETPQGKSAYWDGPSLRSKAKELNKWIEVKESFKLPADTDKNNVLKLYVWNKSKEEILLDDFKVEFK
jgi:hypothetical protein